MPDRWVESDGVRLAVHEQGPPDASVALLVHGYPDTSAVWQEVADRLGGRMRVVTYDVRGAGESGVPSGPGGYRMDRLVADLHAVADAVGDGRPVHLVGHDWGSIQSWAAITAEGAGERFASFTSISGPSLDHARAWMRRRLRRPTPRHLAQLLGQLRRSWYIAAGAPPYLASVAWRLVIARNWGRILAREGVRPRPGHPAPTLADDASHGIGMYRSNMLRRLGSRGPVPLTDVPVQLIVPTRDRFVSPALFSETHRYVTTLRRREIDAGHWVIRSRPDAIAGWIEDFAEQRA